MMWLNKWEVLCLLRQSVQRQRHSIIFVSYRNSHFCVARSREHDGPGGGEHATSWYVFSDWSDFPVQHYSLSNDNLYVYELLCIERKHLVDLRVGLRRFSSVRINCSLSVITNFNPNKFRELSRVENENKTKALYLDVCFYRARNEALLGTSGWKMKLNPLFSEDENKSTHHSSFCGRSLHHAVAEPLRQRIGVPVSSVSSRTDLASRFLQ